MSFSISSLKYSFFNLPSFNEKRFFSLLLKHWKRNRVTVSDSLKELSEDLVVSYGKYGKARIIVAHTGEDILTWKVPLKWKVFEGKLFTPRGKLLVNFAQNPLYLWSYSIPFEGMVDTSVLLEKHLYTILNRPFEIPYHYINSYKFDIKDWGFSVEGDLVSVLRRYKRLKVKINSVFEKGSLYVTDFFLPGRLSDTICFFAHTCHPAQVSDGLVNVLLALELFVWLSSVNQRKYSYRFVFGPEYFGGAAFLSKSDSSVVSSIKGGIYLDMLSNHQPLAFQRSFLGDSVIDKVVRNILRSHMLTLLEYDYRRLWGNDEMFYSSVGFSIPVVGLGRLMHREYHFSSDNLENINHYHLKESFWILQKIVSLLEQDFIPVLNYKGPLYLSRYFSDKNLPFSDNFWQYIEKIQWETINKKSILEISEKFSLDFFEVYQFFSLLIKQNLCTPIKKFSHFSVSYDFEER